MCAIPIPFDSSVSAVRRWALLSGALLVIGWVPIASAQLVVDDASDFPDFDISDGVCQVCYQTDDDGNCIQPGGCTLIAAIQNANLAPNLDVITFSVAAIPNDVGFIPAITTPVRIDGAVGGGRVHIQGPGPTEGSPGLQFDGVASAGSEVYNVEISGYPTGIAFRDSPGGIVQNCVVRGNFIQNAEDPSTGIAVTGASEGALIGGGTDLDAGNVIIGNTRGLLLTGSGQHRVYGNRIGIDEAGQAHGNDTGIVVGLGAGVGTEIGSGEVIHRNVIANNESIGIAVTGFSTGVSGFVRLLRIYGNYIGTDPTGTVPAPNGWGIELARTDSIQIGAGAWGDPRGNFVAGNGVESNTFPWAGTGVYLNNRNTNTLVSGNTIGMGTDLGRLSNEHGVVVRGEAQDVEIERNWIAGNDGHGVVITRVNDFEPIGNRVLMNYIGIEPEVGMDIPNLVLENHGHGVLIEEAEFNQVAANEIGNSLGSGVHLEGEGATENAIEQNVIGAKPNTPGEAPRFFKRPNFSSGISISSGGNNLIDGNEIANNAVGVSLHNADNNTVKNNRLGDATFEYEADGRFVFTDGGNTLAGVLMEEGSDDNEIGAPGQGNECRRNPHCIVVLDGIGNVLRENLIFDSFLEPIDLGGDGRDLNDTLDADIGPNLRQNAPFVTAAFLDGQEFVVEGQLEAAPSTAYVVEAFIEFGGWSRRGGLPAASHPLGTVDVTTDASGVAPYTVRGTPPPFIISLPNAWGTATATDPAGNTSELRTLADGSSQLRPVVLQLPTVPGLPDPVDGELAFRLDVSNLSNQPAIGVELEIEFGPPTGIEYEVNEVVLEEEEAMCVGGDDIPISCTIGEIEGRSWVSPVVYITAEAAAFGGGLPYEVQFVVRGEIGGEPFVTNEVVRTGVLAVAAEDAPASAATTLSSLYPNPFRHSTTILYTQATSVPATITVFDVLGRRVRTFEPTRTPGEHVIVWDGADAAGRPVASGVYFVQLTTEGVPAPARSVVVQR